MHSHKSIFMLLKLMRFTVLTLVTSAWPERHACFVLKPHHLTALPAKASSVPGLQQRLNTGT